VLASAIGKPSAALVPTAWRGGTLHQVMKGTDRKAPPAPTSADRKPMPPPTAARPRGRAVRVRGGAGAAQHLQRHVAHEAGKTQRQRLTLEQGKGPGASQQAAGHDARRDALRTTGQRTLPSA
jgi:hypothetical protein